MAEKHYTLQTVAIAEINEETALLRTADPMAEGFQAILDTVRERGVLKPILLREASDPGRFDLIDGLQRLTCARMCGHDNIDAKVYADVDDDELLELQIIANAATVRTDAVAYAGHLARMMAHAEDRGQPMTINKVAANLKMTPSWVANMLGLINLIPQVAELVSSGRIILGNAYQVSKLPADEQAAWIERAIVMTTSELTPAVNARSKQLRDARREGRDAGPASDFVAVPHFQKMSTLQAELESPKAVKQLVAEAGTTDPHELVLLGIRFALHLDPLSVAAQRNKADARRLSELAAEQRRNRERLSAAVASQA